jgi:predicted RNA-binding Zn ribbon-like protein
MVTRRASEIPLVGGDPALDLANTLDGPRHGDPTGDHLHDPEDLVAWAVRAGVLEAHAGAARADVLDRVRRLRAPVYAVFRAIAEGDEPDGRALAEIGEFHVEALRRARLVPAFDYSWDRDDAQRIVWALAVAAVDLLRTGPLDRIRVCHDCRWLFLDTSRNGSRRWCSMNECGARAKMRRYRARRATADR